MRRLVLRLGLALALFGTTACGPDDGRHLAEPDPKLTAVTVPTTLPVPAVSGEVPLLTEGPGGLRISSPDFDPGATFPARSSCGGNVSPLLRWTRSTRRTTELALVVQDIDADGAAQWVITGLGPDLSGIERGTPPPGASVHTNSFGVQNWTSACPVDGFAHRILFTLYTLDRDLPVTSDDLASVVSAIQATAYGSATMLGRASPTVGG